MSGRPYPSTAEVLAARRAAGFVTPVRPLEPGDAWWLAVFPGGLYEVLVHPEEAAWYLEKGIVLDGLRVPVKQVDAYPFLNGILLAFRDPRAAREGFLDASQTETVRCGGAGRPAAGRLNRHAVRPYLDTGRPMSGLIGVIAQETGRYNFFAASLTSLETEEGDEIKWWFGHDIADNANRLVEHLYRGDHEWLWILGDDHTFSPGLLQRLLAQDCDIVVPLCLQRNPPYRPVIHSGWEDEALATRILVDLNDHPSGGLIEVLSAGSAGMLIRREVFDAVPAPWFESGKLSSVQLGEDVYFCDKAREQGFRIFADLDAMLGHCTSTVVWPVREDDGWTFGFSMAGGFTITMPPGVQAYADEVGRHGSLGDA